MIFSVTKRAILQKKPPTKHAPINRNDSKLNEEPYSTLKNQAPEGGTEKNS